MPSSARFTKNSQALEGVLDQLDVRKRELIAVEENLRHDRSNREKLEEEVSFCSTPMVPPFL